MATATAIVAQRVAADRARSDLSARHDSSKAIMSSQSSATKSHLGAAGIGLGAYAAFFFVLYWLMQPTVTANSGLAGYRPPPKTIVKYADAPWELPNSPEALPIRAVDEPAPVIPKRSVTEEPKKETIRHLLLRQEYWMQRRGCC